MISENVFTQLSPSSITITWPAGLYMNGELAQVQSGCLDEVVNIEILQHVLVVKYFDCNMCCIGLQDYRNRVIFEI